MTTLSRQSFEEYRDLLDANAERSVAGFAKAIAAPTRLFAEAEDERNRAVYRQAIVDEVFGRIDTFGAIAQTRADDMFEAMVGMEPAEHAGANLDQCEARVRSAATHLFERGDADAFVNALESFIRREVGAAANIATAENVEAANER